MTSAPASWFAVIDGAQDPRLMDLVRSSREHICLLKGNLDPALERAAPWLARIDEREALMPTWQAHGLGRSWGIMVQSALPIDRLQRHFRRFLQAKLPDGKITLFRFYDPRVFNTYIRAALPAEREPWFDGVDQYAAEVAGGAGLHQYRLYEGRLVDGDRYVD